MTRSTLPTAATTLRPADSADVEAVVGIWHRGWRDGHLGHVPSDLHRYRRVADFWELVPGRLGATTVALLDGAVVGFVMVVADEIEQIYVDAAVRGRGVAAVLLAHAEAVVATGFDRAWLAVVAGNDRARRFYERHGWSDTGPVTYPADTAGDTAFPVPAHRYEKPVGQSLDSGDTHVATHSADARPEATVKNTGGDASGPGVVSPSPSGGRVSGRQERSQRQRVWLPWPSLPNPLRKPKALTGMTSNT